MNKSNLKTYAPQARRDFIDMVTSRAAQLGIAGQDGELKVEDCLVQGEVMVIAGQAFPAKVEPLRKRLLERIRKQGFAQTMEAIAYTWFNRFAALRYMELHDYLGHGQRVLSSVSAGGLPDILTHALELAEAGELPGISRDLVAELKLANKEGELYKRLLVAQCNRLATAMPFLFEKIDDDSELLLPDTLLRTDSVIRKLVDGIPEEDWAQVEVIGWLYQFYISEKKDQVIGKVVKSEDIPAATQLFTPNWIVKYLVQNSIGRLWLMANPQSGLAAQMAYYIQPAEQTPEVQAQLDALIKVRVAEDGEALNPESITVLDPACGSGHILVEAYDLLKAIYLERGYREREIPRLILKNNLFGLDIDDRAAQLAGFALLMKARADDRRLFEDTPALNVLAIQDSQGVDDAVMAEAVMQAAIRLEGGEVLGNGDLFGGGVLATGHSSGLQVKDLRELIRFFEFGKTFGSLLMVPEGLGGKLAVIGELLEKVVVGGDSLARSYAGQILGDYWKQAWVLSRVYDAVVANPPYMGSKGMIDPIRQFAKEYFPTGKADLFALFIDRGLVQTKITGFTCMITMHSWMFLSSFEEFRFKLLENNSIIDLAHFGARAFDSISGEVVQTVAFIISPSKTEYVGRYINAAEPQNEDGKSEIIRSLSLGASTQDLSSVNQEHFSWIGGAPIAFWVPESIRLIFKNNPTIDKLSPPKKGMVSSDNGRFLRLWHEVSSSKSIFNCHSREEAKNCGKKWFAYNKGGPSRKWFGNNTYVINWENDGAEVISYNAYLYGSASRQIQNTKYYFLPSITWSEVGSTTMGGRFQHAGFIFDSTGPSIFPTPEDRLLVLGYLCSSIVTYLSKIINPTLHFTVRNVGSLPFPRYIKADIRAFMESNINDALVISETDWNANETSWSFQSNPIVEGRISDKLISISWEKMKSATDARTTRLAELEKLNDKYWCRVFDLDESIFPVQESTPLTTVEKTKDVQRFISYAIGNMMGRYSLDHPGLIYAHAGNTGFDPTRYPTFPADQDGILPVTDLPWFPDDAANRIREFLLAVWGQATLNENLHWLADSLGRKPDETPEDAIRRYIATGFYKDHLQTYKKRPIYWLFSSGKHKAFEALVYLHRYNEGTLSRMRTEYVVPLTGKMNDRIRFLETEVPKATSTPERKKLEKDIDRLKKKLDELRLFDEKLRHYADRRIALDLDDGVKVNYGKFGDLLAEVKAVTGGSEE